MFNKQNDFVCKLLRAYYSDDEQWSRAATGFYLTIVVLLFSVCDHCGRLDLRPVMYSMVSVYIPGFSAEILGQDLLNPILIHCSCLFFVCAKIAMFFYPLFILLRSNLVLC